MAGLDPAIHVFLCSNILERGCPGHLAKTRFALLPGHDVVDLVGGAELPVDTVPVQCADDARFDRVAHAVRPRAPRHVRRSPGHRPSRSGARGASSGPMHPGCSGRPGRAGSGRLGLARLSLAHLSLGLDDRGPLDIFRCFRSLRGFGAFRCVRSFARCRSGLRLAASERQASITSLSCGGGQNKSCNQNEFTHGEISP